MKVEVKSRVDPAAYGKCERVIGPANMAVRCGFKEVPLGRKNKNNAYRVFTRSFDSLPDFVSKERVGFFLFL